MPDPIENVWKDVVPKEDQEIYAAAGLGGPLVMGIRPCVILVDVVESMLGPRPGTELTTGHSLACGTMGWERMTQIVALVNEARSLEIPVVLVRGDAEAKERCGGSLKATSDGPRSRDIHRRNSLPEELEVRESDYVLEKVRSSAFFATPLDLYLKSNGIDSIIVGGATTSGCVRSTVVDGSALGHTVFLVEDATFDRSRFSHAVSCFEMHQKYGEVLSLEQLRSRWHQICAGERS